MAEAAKSDQPLDEVMLAMDVVDTLRHRQLLVERELGAEDRDLRMKQRLREIYAAQGIEVPDHSLEQGVAALRQDRFKYDPTPPGLQRALARLYISRARWGKPLLLVLGALILAGLAWWFLVQQPALRAERALPQRLQNAEALLQEQVQGPRATAQAEALLAEGESALSRGAQDEVESVIERMEQLRRDVEASYELRVVSRPGERSGVWRIPDANSSARNYYLIVEAVGRDGSPREVPVVNEEDGKTYRVREWGLRVDEALFNAVARDKSDDGIIQNNRVGVKRRGYLTPDYDVPTTGAAITRW
jgi:hypothetical protein